MEAKFLSCKECGIEFCTGDSCKIFDYDSFKRLTVSAAQPVSEPTQEQISQDKKSLKNKIRNKGPKTKSRSNTNNNAPGAAGVKSRNDKNDVINVKTNKKNSTFTPPPLSDKLKKNVKSINNRALQPSSK